MAATLTVWKFPTATGADTAIDTLSRLQAEKLINVHDAAMVSWPNGAKKPQTRQLHHLAGVGALGGAFWGLLFGILFFIPLIGAAVGAGVGALAGSLSDVGIDDKFIAELKSQITPGTSALFVLTSDATLDRVHDEFHGQHAELVTTNLSHEQEAQLREVFAD
ncbi:DUF1269 domain-containing protein [Nocardia cyriacigeorgica]|uniref:DUF1269 domain-containing protein n=1 Tax=Nocardia cyriacigeorgica TaxID=135487 RepID=UPI002458CA7E|nr:DUF1269 domain-containing protein [Nocardia cyriacigeorgica]